MLFIRAVGVGSTIWGKPTRGAAKRGRGVAVGVVVVEVLGSEGVKGPLVLRDHRPKQAPGSSM